MINTHPLEELAKRLEKAFEVVENPRLIPVMERNPVYMDISVAECREGFTLRLALNDINPDEVFLDWADGQMTIESVRIQANEKDETIPPEFETITDEANIDTEQLEHYLPFHYRITLPENVDPASVTVEFVDDALEIQFFKAKITA